MSLDVSSFLDSPGKPLPIDLVLDPEGTSLLPGELRFCGGIHVRGEAFAQLGTLYVEAEIQAEIERRCRRCLAPLRSTVERSESFEVEIPPGEVSVDLLPQVLAAVVGTLDPRPLCRRECRGLCPTCGQDLNAQPAHVCRPPGEAPRRLGDFLRS
jgi:uncharacterized protein